MARRGGGGGRRRAAGTRPDAPARDDDQRYGLVTAMLGHGRVTVNCDDGVTRRCKIRGSMRRREWVHVGETVLVSLRPELAGSSVRGAEDVGDVVHRYTPPELAKLARQGEPVRIAPEDEEQAALEEYVTFGSDEESVDDI
jgi:translation initiation factor 1A